MPPYNTPEDSRSTPRVYTSDPSTKLAGAMKSPMSPDNQIASEMDLLNESTLYMIERASLLRNRLSPLLTPLGESIGEATPMPNLSPLGEAIRRQRDQVQEATRVINSVLAELSL